MTAWKLESAKARLSEVVRQARDEGPQTITVRGAETAVVLSAEDYARVTAGAEGGNWVDRLRGNFIGEVDLERDRDPGRELEL